MKRERVEVSWLRTSLESVRWIDDGGKPRIWGVTLGLGGTGPVHSLKTSS